MGMKEWQELERKQVNPEELRDNYIHAHSVVWLALAFVGNYLINNHPTDWHHYIGKLGSIDWSRNNPVWSGRCVVSGRISKSRQNIILTANQIMKEMGLSLPKNHQEVESTFN